MEKKKINTQKYKNSILCYNADSSQNKAKTITEFVKVKLNIGDHLEQIHLEGRTRKSKPFSRI